MKNRGDEMLKKLNDVLADFAEFAEKYEKKRKWTFTQDGAYDLLESLIKHQTKALTKIAYIVNEYNNKEESK